MGGRQYSCKEQTEALAELVAHREEAGYGWKVAARLGCRVETLRKWMAEAGEPRERLFSAKKSKEERAAAVKELAAHRTEAGYGHRVAQRLGLKAETLMFWMKAAGVAYGKLFSVNGGRGWRREATKRSVRLWNPGTRDEAAPERMRCGITGKRCGEAWRCTSNLAAGGWEKMHPIDVCEYAVQCQVDKCTSCPHVARCAETWRCWVKANRSFGRSLLAEYETEHRRTVWDCMAEGVV